MVVSYGRIRAIALPILTSLLIETLIGVTDTAFLGRVGEVELGASALGGVYYMAIFMVGFGFSTGAQILIARRNGEGNVRAIGPIVQQGVLFLLLVAGVVFCLSRLCTPRLLHHMIGSEAVWRASVDYMQWRVYGFFFSFVAIMMRAFYIGTTSTRVLTLNAVVMLLCNAGLNYLLIFGHCGLPALGIAGAAIASSAAELVSALYFLLHARFRVDHRRYGLFVFSGWHPRLLGRMLSVSVWTMLQSFLSVVSWFLFFAAIEHLGERPLAVTNIVRSISGLLFMFVSTFGATVNTLTGNLMGEGRVGDVMPTVRRTIALCMGLLLPLVALFFAVPQVVLRIYTDDPALIAASVGALRVMVTAYVVTTPAVILFSAVSGTGNTRAAFLIELAPLALYIAYVGWMVFGVRADVMWCWSAEHVYALGLLLVTGLYLRFASWQNKRI